MPARRKPTAELAASGSLAHDPKRHADRADEPTPPPLEDDAPPAWLTHELAKKHWPEFWSIAKNMRVLTQSDTFALCMLAEAFASWREAIMRVNGKPGPKLPRDLTSLDKAHRQFLEMLREFGMTPVARTRIRAEPKPPKENKFGALASTKRPGKPPTEARDE